MTRHHFLTHALFDWQRHALRRDTMGTRALDARALARRLGCSLSTAYRRIDTLRARQSDPDVLRVSEAPAAIGSGAVRRKRVVLWPVASNTDGAPPAND